MKWTVDYSDDAEIDLENMPKEIAIKVVKKMDIIVLDPYEHLHKMRGLDLYSFKVKNYRGIVTLRNRKMVVLVVKVKHRNVAYRNLK